MLHLTTLQKLYLCCNRLEVLPAAMEIARDIEANVAPLSAAITKRLLWQSSLLTPEEVELIIVATIRELFDFAATSGKAISKSNNCD